MVEKVMGARKVQKDKRVSGEFGVMSLFLKTWQADFEYVEDLSIFTNIEGKIS